MKPRIFLSGGSGFIGKNLNNLLKERYTVYAPSSRELDLTDSGQCERYLRKHRFDGIIHSATHNATDVSPKDRSLVFSVNMRMFMNIARCSGLFGRMIYFGSAAEYHKDHLKRGVTEDFFDTYVPISDYGYSKYLMAKYTEHAANIYDLRLFGVYGKYEDWRIRFISDAVLRVLRNEPVVIHRNVLMDYLYADDLADIAGQFLTRKTIRFRQYNVCTGMPEDLRTIAKIILRIAEARSEVIVESPGKKPPVAGDNSRLLREFPSIRFTQLPDGIRKLYDWYKETHHF
jgi:GDP-L-fucose synthase